MRRTVRIFLPIFPGKHRSRRISTCRTSDTWQDQPPQEATTPDPILDAADRRILSALRADGRLSNARLAELVGLSPTPTWNRVRRLEEQGVIAGYTARIDQKALGLPDTVFIEITLDRHDAGLVQEMGERLARMREVLEVFMVSGDYDYLARVAVDGTAGYEVFLRERLYSLPGVRSCRSVFTLRTLKRDGSPDPS